MANFPGLYRHVRSGRYDACKKLNGIRRECSLGICDRKIAERRLKEWIGNLGKVDAEVEKTTIDGLIQRYLKSHRQPQPGRCLGCWQNNAERWSPQTGYGGGPMLSFRDH